MPDLSLPTLAAKLKANMARMGWGVEATAANCGIATQDVNCLVQGVMGFELPWTQVFARVFNDPSWPTT
jgi:hypothetical protein